MATQVLTKVLPGRRVEIPTPEFEEGETVEVSVVRPQLNGLAETLSRVQALANLPEGRNGYDLAAPNPSAISNARNWLELFHSDITGQGRSWIRPHVSADEDGNVALEFWSGQREMAVYVGPTASRAIKIWGADVNNEMEDAPVESTDQRLAVWQWLEAK